MGHLPAGWVDLEAAGENMLLDIQGDCNRRQEPMRNDDVKSIIFPERDVGPLPAGGDYLETAREHFARYSGGL